MRKIVLASSSPRRKELLGKLNIEFSVIHPVYTEDMSLPLSPDELVKKLSFEKARSVMDTFEDALIIAADSIVVFNGEVLGKPHSAEVAREMLKRLSGQKNIVLTGMTILDTKTKSSDSFLTSTDIFLHELSGEDIERYILTGEPLDKAGAYAIQGIGAVFVEKIEGDFYGAVGLSLAELSKKLRGFGVSVL